MQHIFPEIILPQRYNPSIFFHMHRQSYPSVLYKEKKRLSRILQVSGLHMQDFHSIVRNFPEKVLHKGCCFRSEVPTMEKSFWSLSRISPVFKRKAASFVKKVQKVLFHHCFCTDFRKSAFCESISLFQQFVQFIFSFILSHQSHVQAEYAYLPAFSYTPRFPSSPRKYAHFFCKSDFCARHVLPSFVRLMHH